MLQLTEPVFSTLRRSATRDHAPHKRFLSGQLFLDLLDLTVQVTLAETWLPPAPAEITVAGSDWFLLRRCELTPLATRLTPPM